MKKQISKQMNYKLVNNKCERKLWHGTAVQHTPLSVMPLVRISSKGFNRNYSGSATGT